MDDLLGSMSTEELQEWRVFDAIEPIGQARSDYQTAYLAYMMAATSPRAKNAKRPRLKDFVIDWWDPKRARKPASPMTMLAFAAALTEARGGTVGPEVQEALNNGDRTGPDDGGPGAGFERLQ